MTTNSEKGFKIYRCYDRSEKMSLRDAYGSWSAKKEEAWDYCQKLCKEFNGTGLKIIGANGWHFSAGFRFEKDGKKFLMYITKGGDTPIEIK